MTLLAAARSDAQDTTWLLNMSGEILAPVDDITTKVKVDNSTLKSGFVGSKLLIELTDTTVSINVTDPDGNSVRAIFEFDTVTRTPLNEKSERIFAVGVSMLTDGVPHPKLGSFTFTDATLFGTIKIGLLGEPTSISATIQASGESDEGTFIFTGKANGKTQF